MDWINANALTLVDLQKVEVVGSVLLDDRGKGAANSWGGGVLPILSFCG